MAGITKQRSNEIQSSAMRLVSAYGIANIDRVESPARQKIADGWAGQLMWDYSVSFQTARQHVAKACRRQRHPDWESPNGWGGYRDGAGRKGE